MADLPTDFWGGWITVLTIVSLAGLIWLLLSVYFGANGHAEDELPTWDENLREGTQAPPMWWFWMLLAILVFSDIYLVLYPGLGSFKGALNWSQGSRLSKATTNYDKNFQGLRRLVKVAPIETLHEDADLMASARRVFNQNCGACHGPDGEGQASYFPNLRDDIWQWGGDAAQIEQTIRSGRQAAMPGWIDVLGADGVQNVAQYIRTLSNEDGPPAEHPGKTQYNQICVACHGADGSGNPALGAPSLADGDWLYGNSDEALTHSIALGRNGIMPPFGDRLDDVQLRMLVAWLTLSDVP